MRSILHFLTFSATLISIWGCGQTRHLPLSETARETARRGGTSTAEVSVWTTTGGIVLGPYSARDIQIGMDSTYWTDHEGRTFAFASRTLARVTYHTGGRGAGMGMLIGMAPGAMLALRGMSEPASVGVGRGRFQGIESDIDISVGFVGMLVGGAVGALFGSSASADEYFIVRPQEWASEAEPDRTGPGAL